MKFGTRNADGSVATNPDECALTGRPLHGEVVTHYISGTPGFYKVLARYYHLFTPEAEAKILGEYRGLTSAKPVIRREDKSNE